MPYDGSNGARARASRIRAAHDDEATRLETMRRRAQASRAGEPQAPSLIARALRALARRPVAADALPRLEHAIEGETPVVGGV